VEVPDTTAVKGAASEDQEAARKAAEVAAAAKEAAQAAALKAKEDAAAALKAKEDAAAALKAKEDAAAARKAKQVTLYIYIYVQLSPARQIRIRTSSFKHRFGVLFQTQVRLSRTTIFTLKIAVRLSRTNTNRTYLLLYLCIFFSSTDSARTRICLSSRSENY
jgi:hypothetical protein